MAASFSHLTRTVPSVHLTKNPLYNTAPHNPAGLGPTSVVLATRSPHYRSSARTGADRQNPLLNRSTHDLAAHSPPAGQRHRPALGVELGGLGGLQFLLLGLQLVQHLVQRADHAVDAVLEAARGARLLQVRHVLACFVHDVAQILQVLRRTEDGAGSQAQLDGSGRQTLSDSHHIMLVAGIAAYEG